MKTSISLPERIVRFVLGSVMAACVALLGYMATQPEHTERRTAGLKARQFYRADGTLTLDDDAGAFGAAHNSGDDLGQLRRALRYGADIIEIDVVMMDGRLVAAHDRPMPLLGKAVFRGPSLVQAWSAAQDATAIMLDVKQTGRRYVDALVRFLQTHPGTEVAVVSSSPSVLRTMRDEVPTVLRFLSIGNRAMIERLHDENGLLELVDGISVQHRLLDGEFVDWSRSHELLIAAWVANDLARVNELVGWGVDIVTTDNLAVLELLAEQERAHPSLALRKDGDANLAAEMEKKMEMETASR